MLPPFFIKCLKCDEFSALPILCSLSDLYMPNSLVGSYTREATYRGIKTNSGMEVECKEGRKN